MSTAACLALSLLASSLGDEALLAKLAGTWKVTGTIEGEAVEQTLNARFTLADRFLELHFVGTQSPEPGMPPYEARVFVGFHAKSKRFVGHWLDVFGAAGSAMGSGERKSESIVIVYPYGSADFRNTFTPGDKGTWRLLVESRKKDQTEWNVFADQKLTPVGTGETVLVLAIAADGKMFLGNKVVDPEQLKAKLVETKPPRLTIAADKGLPHGKVIEAIDVVKSAGIENISFAVQAR